MTESLAKQILSHIVLSILTSYVRNYLEVFFLSTCERISPIQSLPMMEALARHILSHIVFVFMNVKLCQLLYITHLSRQTSISQVIFFLNSSRIYLTSLHNSLLSGWIYSNDSSTNLIICSKKLEI